MILDETVKMQVNEILIYCFKHYQFFYHAINTTEKQTYITSFLPRSNVESIERNYKYTIHE